MTDPSDGRARGYPRFHPDPTEQARQILTAFVVTLSYGNIGEAIDALSAFRLHPLPALGAWATEAQTALEALPPVPEGAAMDVVMAHRQRAMEAVIRPFMGVLVALG